MSKTVRVKYTFEVIRTVTLSDEKPPKPYDAEEWENQQIEEVGEKIEFELDGSVNWYFRRLDQ